jgi:hypothetical protein
MRRYGGMFYRGDRKDCRGTLNDTELRKNFRRKNTPRKSFLGHALWLNDLPIEAATARPNAGFPAHRRELRRPTAGKDQHQSRPWLSV